MEKVLLTYHEAAEVLGVTHWTVRAGFARGDSLPVGQARAGVSPSAASAAWEVLTPRHQKTTLTWRPACRERRLHATQEKSSPYWWASFVERGKRIRRSTGTPDLNEAKALEAKWRAQAYREQHWEVKPPRTFEEVMLEYLRDSAHLRSIETLKMQTTILRRFFGGRDVGELTGQDIKSYTRWRREAGRANATINRELAALSSAINHCNKEWEWGLPNPVKADAQGAAPPRTLPD